MVRAGSFFPSLLEPRRRVDQALWAAIVTACMHGTSTRKVDDLVRALGVDTGVSKSTVSRICAQLDEHVVAFRHRTLDHAGFPVCVLRRQPRQGPQRRAGRVPRGGRSHQRRPMAPARSTASMSATARTRPPGLRSRAARAAAARPVSGWPSATPTKASRRRSRACCRTPAGNAAGCPYETGAACLTMHHHVPSARFRILITKVHRVLRPRVALSRVATASAAGDCASCVSPTHLRLRRPRAIASVQPASSMCTCRGPESNRAPCSLPAPFLGPSRLLNQLRHGLFDLPRSPRHSGGREGPAVRVVPTGAGRDPARAHGLPAAVGDAGGGGHDPGNRGLLYGRRLRLR